MRDTVLPSTELVRSLAKTLCNALAQDPKTIHPTCVMVEHLERPPCDGENCEHFRSVRATLTEIARTSELGAECVQKLNQLHGG